MCGFILALIFALPASATTGTQSGSDRAEIDPAVLARTVDEFSRIVDALAESGDVTGLSAAIVHGDDVLLEKSIGVADISSGSPIGPDTVFRVASLSKAFSSTLAGLLVQDGWLGWNTHVSDVLPFFKMSTDNATKSLTLRDVLSQRTGLPYYTYDKKLEKNIPYRKLIRQLDRVTLACKVGDCYSYQNVAFSLFGDMVYPLTGDFFTHQVSRRIFQPLGMTTASFGLASLEQSTSWARPHVRSHGHFETVVPEPNYYWVAPAAGVNASIRDMERWLSAQMGNAPKVLPLPLLSELQTPVVKTKGQLEYSRWRPIRLDDAHYALGWRIYNYAGHKLVYHAGAVRGYRAIIGFLPEYNIGMVALWNCSCSRPGSLMPMFVDRILQLPEVNWIGLDWKATSG